MRRMEQLPPRQTAQLMPLMAPLPLPIRQQPPQQTVLPSPQRSRSRLPLKVQPSIQLQQRTQQLMELL